MNRGRTGFLLVLLFSLLSCQAQEFQLPPASTQLILGVSGDWDDSHAVLQCWERRDGLWVRVGEAWPSRLGARGLAWGKGLHPAGMVGPEKREGDQRAPAGIFQLGDVYAYDPQIRARPGLKIHQVTEKDLWVEDVQSPYYNQHRQLPNRGPQTEWEKKQQMRLHDPAHSLKLFIKHNAGAGTVPGAGSSIFFHIWREAGAKASHGCTVMSEERLRQLLAWIDPAKQPLYVLLPEKVYREKKAIWALPE
jgi:L,D-peptidoglycan transpeptidase YkuD (ErfK/YbiS/YcfS/YnhG family)